MGKGNPVPFPPQNPLTQLHQAETSAKHLPETPPAQNIGWVSAPYAMRGRTASISSVLCKAQPPTASTAFTLSEVLTSSSIKLPLMGLSAPSTSKGGTWPAALSCFTCTAPLIILVSQMCSSHDCANNRPPTQAFSNIL